MRILLLNLLNEFVKLKVVLKNKRIKIIKKSGKRQFYVHVAMGSTTT